VIRILYLIFSPFVYKEKIKDENKENLNNLYKPNLNLNEVNDVKMEVNNEDKLKVKKEDIRDDNKIEKVEMNEEMSGEEKSMVVPKNDNRNESDIELLQRMRDRLSNHFKIAQELIENDNSTKENPNEKKKNRQKTYT